MTLTHDHTTKNLTICKDRFELLALAKPALSELMTRVHVYRCTADVNAVQDLYESITNVDDEWLKIRETILYHIQREPPRIFVQANTFVQEDGSVTVKEYNNTDEGVIQSWVERDTQGIVMCLIINIGQIETP